MLKAVTKNRTFDLVERKLHLTDPWYQLIIKMLNPVIHNFNGKRMLEVGCGFGGFCVHVARERAEVIGLDISSRSIHKANNLAKQLGVQRQVNFIIGDAQFLPFKDQTNEIVVCSETLEHVTNHEKALCEIVRVTRRSGYVCITVPNLLSTSFFEYIILLLIGQPQYVRKQVCLEKEHIFHIFKVRKLFCIKKLKVIKIRSTDFLHLPPRVRKALKISRSLKTISDRIEDYLETHDLPLKFFGANIGVLARKE